MKKYSAGFVEMDTMEGFTFKPKNEPTLCGKREHSRPIDGEHSTSKFSRLRIGANAYITYDTSDGFKIEMGKMKN